MVEEEDDDGSVGIAIPSIKQTEDVNDLAYGDDLDEDKRTQMKALMTEFGDVLTDVPGRTDIISHSNELTSKEHVRSRPYPVPQSLRETIKDEVEMMMYTGVIEKSTSPYASPV